MLPLPRSATVVLHGDSIPGTGHNAIQFMDDRSGMARRREWRLNDRGSSAQIVSGTGQRKQRIILTALEVEGSPAGL